MRNPIKQKARQMAVACAQHLPVSSKYIGLPRGVYASAKEYAKLRGAERAGVEYKTFLPESISRRNPPQSVDGTIHWKFDGRCQHTDPETFMITIPGGRTAGGMGAVITHDDRLLLDVSRDFSSTHHLFKRLTLSRCRHLPGRVAVLATASGNTYFHWLTDALPRIEILQKTLPGGLDAVDRFVVNSGFPIIGKSLEMMGIPAEKILFAEASTHIQADELMVPSLPGISGDPPQWACSFLRESFLPHKADSSPQTRLYISRSQARYRRVENEDEVVGLLSGYGFIPVRLEEHSFAEQIALFANADVIVAPHGAGLTNLLWCRPGTRVLELFSPDYVNVCYWAMANQLGLDYHCLTGNGAASLEGIDLHRVQADIAVPISKLELFLSNCSLRRSDFL